LDRSPSKRANASSRVAWERKPLTPSWLGMAANYIFKSLDAKAKKLGKQVMRPKVLQSPKHDR
jgi:hypothetical protein